MTAWSIRQLTAQEIATRRSTLRDLYLDAYREPPYCEDETDADGFLADLDANLDAQGFSLFAAVSSDDELIGFAYGFTFPSERWWRDAGEPPAALRGLAKFAVIELVVARRRRREGIATELMNTLLSGRPEPFATLCANPDAPARAMYAAWGWHKVAEVAPPRIGPMDVLVMPVAGRLKRNVAIRPPD